MRSPRARALRPSVAQARGIAGVGGLAGLRALRLAVVALGICRGGTSAAGSLITGLGWTESATALPLVHSPANLQAKVIDSIDAAQLPV